MVRQPRSRTPATSGESRVSGRDSALAPPKTPSGAPLFMQKKTGGIAARAGRWSARHKKTAIFGWLAFVVIALMIGNMAGTKKPTDAQQFDGESKRAETII